MLSSLYHSAAGTLSGKMLSSSTKAQASPSNLTEHIENSLEGTEESESDEEEQDHRPVEPPALFKLGPRKTEFSKQEIGRKTKKITLKPEDKKYNSDETALVKVLNAHDEGLSFRKSTFRKLVYEILQDLQENNEYARSVEQFKLLAHNTLHQAAEEFIEDLYREIVEDNHVSNPNIPVPKGILTSIASRIHEHHTKLFLDISEEDLQVHDTVKKKTKVPDPEQEMEIQSNKPKKSQPKKNKKTANKTQNEGDEQNNGSAGSAAQGSASLQKRKNPKSVPPGTIISPKTKKPKNQQIEITAVDSTAQP